MANIYLSMDVIEIINFSRLKNYTNKISNDFPTHQKPPMFAMELLNYHA